MSREEEVKAYMYAGLEDGDYRDSAGEINCTVMAEDAAWNFDWNVVDLDILFEWSFEVAKDIEQAQQKSGECVECGRFASHLSPNDSCEGCVMQAVIDSQEE